MATFRRVLVLMLATTAAARGDSPPAAMSLRDAVAYAHAHQPSLAAARARVAVARAEALVPVAAHGTRVAAAVELLGGTANNTTTSYAALGVLDVARVGGTPANAAVSWRPDASSVAGVVAHRELYDFGRLEAQQDALEAAASAQEQAGRAQQLDVDLLVEESFYAVQAGEAVLQASDAAVVRARTHRDFAQARVTAQLMPPIELARAEADLARDEVDRIRSAGQLAVEQAVLAGAIGSELPAIDAGADDLVFQDPPAARDGLRDALARAPELRAARDQITAQERITAAIRDELHPDLSVSAEITGRAGGAPGAAGNATPFGDGFVPDVPNWDALVVLSWPIFDRTVDARAHSSEQQVDVRRAELAEASAELRMLAQRRYVELDLARDALPALRRAVDAADANHSQAEARFQGGLGNAVELSDAEGLLTDAQIQLAVGTFELARARARVARVIAEVAP